MRYQARSQIDGADEPPSDSYNVQPSMDIADYQNNGVFVTGGCTDADVGKEFNAISQI